MLLEKTTELLKKSKIALIVFIVVVPGLLVVYFIAFFSKGLPFEGEFLHKRSEGPQIEYSGGSMWGDISVRIIGEKNEDKTADVIYDLPGGIFSKFSVTYKNQFYWKAGITEIRSENGEVLFRGRHIFMHPYLFNEDGTMFRQYPDGRPAVEITVAAGGISKTSPFHDGYEIQLQDVANTAALHSEKIRGNPILLFLGLYTIFIVLLDFTFPLMFFTLKTVFLTDDAEPSDIYIFFQRLGWTILPVAAVVLMLAALVT
ncbi:MAG: hypothetical protein JXB33_02865 [Clostridia bacterium]|nr:hypothetical protein [Clostridia bacterium]